MPRCFVVHEPLRRDPETGEFRRAMSFRDARRFGEVEVLYAGESQPPADLAPVVADFRARLAGFVAGDYLVLAGAPELIALAAALAATETGGILDLLVWDRDDRRYYPRRVDLRSTDNNGRAFSPVGPTDLEKARALINEDRNGDDK